MGMREQTKPVRRPKKAGAARRRRQKNQSKRLVALGVSEAKVGKMNTKQIRTLLKRPALVKKA